MNKNIFIVIACCSTLNMLGMKRKGEDLVAPRQIKQAKKTTSFNVLLKMEDFKNLSLKLIDQTSNVNEKDQAKISFLENVFKKMKKEECVRAGLLKGRNDFTTTIILPRIVTHLKECSERIQELQKICIEIARHPSFKKDSILSNEHILNFLADKYIEEESIEFASRDLHNAVEELKKFVKESSSCGNLNYTWKEKYPEEMQTTDFEECLAHSGFAVTNKKEVDEIIEGFGKENELYDQINISIINTCDKKIFVNIGRSPLHRLALRTTHKNILNSPNNESKKYIYNKRTLSFASLLLLNDHDPNFPSPSSNSTPLLYCSNNKANSFIDKPMAHLLIMHGACVKHVNSRGSSFESKAGEPLTQALKESAKICLSEQSIALSLNNSGNKIHFTSLLSQRETGMRHFSPAIYMLKINKLLIEQATNFALHYIGQEN